MLELAVGGTEIWDEQKERFIDVPPQVLKLEHSLISVSKWESKWKKVFLDEREKTREEIIDYARCMTLNNVRPDTYEHLTNGDILKIKEYIDEKRSATWFAEKPGVKGKRSSEKITSELIYYWMISYQIPFECAKWHISRLLTLIQVCEVKSAPARKMSQKDIMAQNRALNNARRAKHHTRG